MDYSFSGDSVDYDCKENLHKTVKLCEELGHDMVQDSPEVDVNLLGTAMQRFHISNIVTAIEKSSKTLGRVPSEKNIEPLIWSLYKEGLRMSALDLTEAVDIQNQISRKIANFFEKYDVLLLPTMASPPNRIDEEDGQTEDIKELMRNNTTSLFNLTGLPAISLPLGQSKNDLPVGLQFASGFGKDSLLLKLARQLEQASPWEKKHLSMLEKLY